MSIHGRPIRANSRLSCTKNDSAICDAAGVPQRFLIRALKLQPDMNLRHVERHAAFGRINGKPVRAIFRTKFVIKRQLIATQVVLSMPLNALMVDVHVLHKRAIRPERESSAALIGMRVPVEAGVRRLNAVIGIGNGDVLPPARVLQQFQFIQGKPEGEVNGEKENQDAAH